jgi:hypothetical protein
MKMLALLLLPAGLQALAMAIDEWVCHRRRGLPKWERIGHPLDTLSVAVCYGWLLVTQPSEPNALLVYVGLSALSCLMITKDETVHAKVCDAQESWLHAVLFVLHPIVFMTFGLIWRTGEHREIIALQCALTVAFAVYQITYWSLVWKPKRNIALR